MAAVAAHRFINWPPHCNEDGTFRREGWPREPPTRPESCTTIGCSIRSRVHRLDSVFRPSTVRCRSWAVRSAVELLVALSGGPPLSRPLQPVTFGVDDGAAQDENPHVVVVGTEGDFAGGGDLLQSLV